MLKAEEEGEETKVDAKERLVGYELFVIESKKICNQCCTFLRTKANICRKKRPFLLYDIHDNFCLLLI